MSSSSAAAPSIAFGRRAKAVANPRPVRMQLSTDMFRVSMMLLTILTISRIHNQFPALNPLRPALVLTGLVAMWAFLNPSLLAKGNVFRTWPAKVMIAFFVMACLSVAFGISMGNAGKTVLDSYVKVVAFCILVMVSIRNVRDLYTITWAATIASGILAYMAVFVFKLHSYNAYARLDNLYMYDGNDTGCVLTASLGLVLLHTKTSRPFGRILALAIFIIMFVAIARTGSRGAMLGLIAAGVGLLILAKGVSIPGRLFFVGVAYLALAAWAPRGYWQQMRTILEPKKDYNYTEPMGRKQVAERGMGYMRQYPLFGVGISNFPKAECELSDYATKRIGPALRCSAPHNSYIQAGAELGIPGLVLWVFFMLAGIVSPILLRRKMPKHWANGDAEERYLYQVTVFLPISFLAYATTTFFLTFAFMDFTYFLMAMLGGLILATRYKMRQNLEFPPPARAVETQGERRSLRFAPAEVAGALTTRAATTT